MKLGDRIREARKRVGINQDELARRIDVNPVSISYWESGKREVRMSTLERIAEALDTPLHFFYEEVFKDELEEMKTRLILDEPSAEKIQVPIIAFVRCGDLASSENLSIIDEFMEEYGVVTKDELRGYNANDVFFSIAEGDSMEPEVREGDRVLMAATDVAYHGDMVVVSFADTDEVTLKWFAVKDGEYFLVPENKRYKRIPLRGRDFRVVAKVLKIHRVVNFPKRKQLEF